MTDPNHYIRWFEQLTIEDVPLVGGKNASLGEMYQNLSSEGVLVPNGFAVTAEAYNYVLESNNAWQQLHAVLDDLEPDNIVDLQIKGKQARDIVMNCKLPNDLRDSILQGYAQLKTEYGAGISLAVRSSATAEDSPEASFAGQNDSFLNINSDEALLHTYKKCLASNFTDRSIHYKFDNHFDFYKVFLSVVVMKMVRSDIGVSGVMFSLDTETSFKDVVFINAALGLGENIVQGTIDPDTFYVHKPTFVNGYRAILKRRLGSKKQKMIFTDPLQTKNINVKSIESIDTTDDERNHFCITKEDIMVLADYAIKVENHYSDKAGVYRPMDMEWAKDGIDGKVYMVQARPETVSSKKTGAILELYYLKETSEVLASGQAVGTRIGSGKVRVIDNLASLSDFQAGEILVADTTTPDWEPIMKIASAIVTNCGGRTCHAAIVARELGVPAIVGVNNATEILRNDQAITACCAKGEIGLIYSGILKFKIEHTDLGQLARPKTQIMMNLGNPDKAFSLASLPVDGIGLARVEFIINEYINIHPMAINHPEKVDEATRAKISVLSAPYNSAEDFFIKALSEGVATLAASVYPKPCVVRMSDFKSNEYATLLGGSHFEPVENNPMIGFRGASRYTHRAYSEGFALECAAMKRVRDEMGLSNVILMIPFCRTIAEGKKVLDFMATQDLKRGENGLQIYVMCEIPNNVIQITAFSELFDGFSIGSNDLTQLTLGVDRDSALVAIDFDERDPGVKEMIRLAVVGAKSNKRHISICGQAPSDYPDMVEFLVKTGIDTISLNPDSIIATTRQVLVVEST
ncbi:MAG: pyruvate,water dikinase [Alphaproteobacteria bacterium]|jgi:pyruvate,water dikinase